MIFKNQKINILAIILTSIIIIVGFALFVYQKGFNVGLNTKTNITNKYNNSTTSTNPNQSDSDSISTQNEQDIQLNNYDIQLLQKYQHLNTEEE